MPTRAGNQVYPFASNLGKKDPTLAKELEEVWRSLDTRVRKLTQDLTLLNQNSYTNAESATLQETVATLQRDVALLQTQVAGLAQSSIFSLISSNTVLQVTTPAGAKYITLSDSLI